MQQRAMQPIHLQTPSRSKWSPACFTSCVFVCTQQGLLSSKQNWSPWSQRANAQCHCYYVLFKYKLLSFENVITFGNVQMLFKMVPGSAPPPLNSFIRPLRCEVRTRRTRSASRWECRMIHMRNYIWTMGFSNQAQRTGLEPPTPDQDKLQPPVSTDLKKKKKYN